MPSPNMAASVLSSPEAVAMSVFVVRAFVQMRERLVKLNQIAIRQMGLLSNDAGVKRFGGKEE